MVKFLKSHPMSGRVRVGLMYVSAALIVSGTVSKAVYLRAATMPSLVPTTVTVHQRSKTPSIYHVQIVDPFGAQPEAVAGMPAFVSSAAAGVPGANVPMTVPHLGALSVPNPDGSIPSGGPVPAGIPQGTATYTLQATLLGNPSVAEFESGQDIELLKVGDMLGDRRIVRITKGEVEFADGTRITMSGGQNTATAMASPSVSASPAAQMGNAVATPAPQNATPPPATPSTAAPATAPAPTVLVTPAPHPASPVGVPRATP